MKAALALSTATRDPEAKVGRMVHLAREAAAGGAELVLFGEAAPTGLISDDNPAHDLPLGRTIPGPITDRLGATARECRLYLGTVVLEREEDHLYDAAVLIDPDGRIVLHYRRMQPQWHGRKADPAVYRQGTEIATVRTPFGRLVVLICGGLFDDDIVARARSRRADYVLFPFCRNFDDGSFDQDRWQREEQAAYAARACAVGCTTLMVNLIEDRELTPYCAFGGAMAVSARGEILARQPLGHPGVLLCDLWRPRGTDLPVPGMFGTSAGPKRI